MAVDNIRVAFAPGLKGTKSNFEEQHVADFTAGTAKGVYDAVDELGGLFELMDYQYGDTDETRFPRFSKMAEHFACQVELFGPDLIVASSVGAFIALQSMMITKKPVDMILLMPVFDVLGKAVQLSEEGVNKLLNAQIPMLPIPVESTEAGGEAGHFPMNALHFTDDNILEILDERTSPDVWLDKALGEQDFNNVAIARADNDPMCTRQEQNRLAEVLGSFSKVRPHQFVFEGGHGEDRTQKVTELVTYLVREKGFGARRPS